MAMVIWLVNWRGLAPYWTIYCGYGFIKSL